MEFCVDKNIKAHNRLLFRLSMAELVLDPDIRLWVFLPIVFITLLFGIIRHYVSQLLHVDAKPGLEEIKDG